MQLTIFKWTMVVAILLSIFNAQADDEKDSKICLRSESEFDDISNLGESEESSDERRIYRRMSSLDDLNRGALAQKMAKEALKSAEVQETIRKLSNVKEPQRNPNEVIKVPVIKGAARARGKHRNPHKRRGRKKKKRKNRRKKLPSGHPHSKKGGSSKQIQGTRKSRKKESKGILKKHSEPKNKHNSIKSKDTIQKSHGKSDPNDLNADVLKDLHANKIQIKFRESGEDPNDRYIRETIKNSSYYMNDQIPKAVEDYSLDSSVLEGHDSVTNDLFLDDKNGNGKSITTEQMFGSESDLLNFDIVTVADFPNNSLDLAIHEYNSYNNKHSHTQLKHDFNNVNVLNNQNKIDKIHSPQFKKSNSTTEDSLEVYSDPYYIPYQKNYEPPPIHLSNPMEQPLGKVLKSLGIDTDSKHRQLPTSSAENHLAKASSLSSSLSISQPSVLDTHIDNNQNTNLQIEKQKDGKLQNKKSDMSKTTLAESKLKQESNKGNKTHSVKPKQKEKHPGKTGDTKTVPDTENHTKEVANEILGRIMDELEEMKSDHSKNKSIEGIPCRLTGSWLTSQAGLRFDITVSNRSIAVEVAKSRIRPALLEMPLNATWNISGQAPFKRGAPFSLLAINNHTKSMAVFVGACRVCQGVDTIAGVWSIAHQPTDCRDFHISTSIFNDVFRKIKQPSHIKETRATQSSIPIRNSSLSTQKVHRKKRITELQTVS